MRYAQIRKMDISNGEGIGISLFTQGCILCCLHCHNASIWNLNEGKEWTKESEQLILQLMDRSQITRFSILGGEPLLKQNVQDLAQLCAQVKQLWPQKKIWLWSGYLWEDIYALAFDDNVHSLGTQKNWTRQNKNNLQELLENIDILVDGPFIQEQKDITLKWRGSKNQRVISVQTTLNHGLGEYPVLYCD